MADNRQIFFDALKGAGLTSQQALGALWGLGGESGPSLNTSAYNPNDPGGSVGAGQWLGDRRAALEAYARSNGKNVTDAQTQANYLVGELTGQKWAKYQPGVLEALKQARTPEEAAHIWTAKFERPRVDNSAQRIAAGGQVGSIDAQGNFVPGTAKGMQSPPGPRVAGGVAVAPPTVEQTAGSSIGSALASLGGSESRGGVIGGGYGSGFQDPPDAPAIRTMAAESDFMPGAANPVPQQFAGGAGSSPLASQLGSLAAQPPAPAGEAADPSQASITQGAPSMTAMLNPIGGQGANLMDPRNPSRFNPNQRFSRLG